VADPVIEAHLPYLVVESDAVMAKEMQEAGIVTLFGDAANSDFSGQDGLNVKITRIPIKPLKDDATMLLLIAF
jgi:hypothetical protein